jgi:hypothetical protein
MTETIFISHAGADWPVVSEITQRLASRKLRVLVDRDELDLGDSFIQFMENSLASADYCLLLWSAAASKSQWVRVEWEAAFHRTITESQRFLIVGMLESYPVPELLRPRLRIDFFPDPDPGVAKLTELVRNDCLAEEKSQKPVVSPKIEPSEDIEGCPVYVSSELFGKTFPWRAELKMPAAIIVEQLVNMLGLPRQLDHQGIVGLRFRYHLALGEERLKPEIALGNQGVTENSLLWLQTEIQSFARTNPVQGNIADTVTVFRDDPDGHIAAERELLAHISKLGLGP